MNGLCFGSILIMILIRQTTSSYYHELSRILLQADDHLHYNETDFGFKIEYQKDLTPKLIIGAPRYDLDGKVYTCDIEDCLKKDMVTCPSVDINIQGLANTTRSVNPNQHFYLGATIAAVKDYFLTCAPLWTFDGMGKVSPGMYGTCFIYNGTAHRYNGIFEKKVNDNADTGSFSSGYGWNTLADEVNGHILITKPVVYLDILTLPCNNPFDEAQSLRSKSKKIRDLMSKQYNLGYGLAAGQFFDKQTTYAFSFTGQDTKGMIAFLKHKHNAFRLVTSDHSKPYIIMSKLMGSMFGASLCSANIDQMGYSELIIGAPGHIDGLEDLEVGAVHIYSMMHENRIQENFMGIIFGSKEGSRFGTAIAADDVDGDTFPEIFISAPFEESHGVVYILSGAEINEVMVKSKNKFLRLSDLKHTQRIAGEGHRKFGFSIKIIPDIDENGCNELAIGSPGDSHVLLFMCIPNVLVKMNTNLVGSQIVSEKANQFDVRVCINVSYQEKPINVISKLLITNNIIGDGVHIIEPTFIVDLAKRETLVCKNITVSISNNDPADYKFTTKLDLHPETKNMLKSKDFQSNLVVLHPFSTQTKSLDIVRRCRGEECIPILSVNVTWFGDNPYLLGSTDVENINITVENTGHNSYGACLWIGLSGAKIDRLDCSEDETKTGYICFMPKPLRMYKYHVINVMLNMSRPLSNDKSLDIDVKLYQDCENRHDPVELKNITIPYSLTADNVLISGLSVFRNVSDKELNNEKLETFNENLEYSIVNNGSITWLGLQVSIIVRNHTFISGIKILAPETDTCVQQDDSDPIEFRCTFNLRPDATKKFMVIASLSKDKLKILFNESSVNISSEAHLSFPSIKLQKIHRITSTIIFQKELSVRDNKLMVIIIGILLACAILIVIVIILYKCNFFQRKQKKKLEELKNTWRRRAMRERRPRETSENANQNQTNVEESEDIEMYVVDDAFEEVPITCDDVQLIEDMTKLHRPP